MVRSELKTIYVQQYIYFFTFNLVFQPTVPTIDCEIEGQKKFWPSFLNIHKAMIGKHKNHCHKNEPVHVKNAF